MGGVGSQLNELANTKENRTGKILKWDSLS